MLTLRHLDGDDPMGPGCSGPRAHERRPRAHRLVHLHGSGVVRRDGELHSCGLGAVFLIAALARVSRGGGLTHPQTRTWLLIAIIFGSVSGWLFNRA